MNDDVLTRNGDGELAVRTVSSTESATVVNPNDVYTRDTDGKLCIRTVGGSSGGSVDYTKVISKTKTMPVAGADNENMIYLYDGATNSTYTHGYVYENKKTATYTGTVSFETATLSGTVVTCSGDDFATFLTESGVEPLSVVSGTMTFDTASSLWILVGKDVNNETVLTFQEYQQDYEDAGFTFTGTPEDGDVVAFTCSIEESAVSYNWVRIDVQPQGDFLPDQTGNAGKVLKTDGATASWESTTLSPAIAPTLVASNWSSNTQTITVQGVTANNTVIVAPIPTNAQDYASAGILCTGQALNSLTFTCVNVPATDLQVNIVIM